MAKKPDDNMKRKTPILSLIVPCFNEEEVLKRTSEKLIRILDQMTDKKLVSKESNIYFIDDGSKDLTWSHIEELHKKEKRFKGIKLSKNVGHQNALMAGLMHTKDLADCTISIDADLQQDEKAIPRFVEQYLQGADIVYGIRNSREDDTFFKKTTAGFFYGLMKSFGTPVIKNHADYRLLSKRALEALAHYNEVNLFLRGIVTNLGFPTATVYFNTSKRTHGTSKYNLKKMLSLALDGITSFSTKPLRIITITGIFIFATSLLMAIYLIIYTLKTHHTVPGWTSIVLPIYLLGGIQIFSIGIIGEYLGKTFLETKHRPKYFIEEII